MFRNKKGEFSTRKSKPLNVKVIFLIALIIASALAYFFNFVGTDYKADAAEVVEVVQKDDITKLTENFEDAIRKLENAKTTLSKAKQHHNDAVDLVNQATENYNVAITSIELYQGQ